MAKEKEEIVEVVAEVPEVELETTEPPSQEETYSQEELNTVVSTELKKQYDLLNKKLSRQGKELERLREHGSAPAQTPAQKQSYDLLLGELERQSEGDPEAMTRIGRIKTDIDRESNQLAYTNAVQIYQGWKDKINQRIEEAGLDPESDEFVEVEESLVSAFHTDGKFERAEKKLNRILGAKPKEKTVEETDKQPELTEEQEAEIARKYLDKQGKLKTDVGSPSGAGKEFADIEKAFSEGDITFEVYSAARKTQKID